MSPILTAAQAFSTSRFAISPLLRTSYRIARFVHSTAAMGSKQDQKHPKFGNLPLSTSGPLDCALTVCDNPHGNCLADMPPLARALHCSTRRT